MVRDEDLATFLACFAAELQNAVRPAVGTAAAAKVVDSLTLVLGRMVAEIRSGGATATIQRQSAAPQVFEGFVTAH